MAAASAAAVMPCKLDHSRRAPRHVRSRSLCLRVVSHSRSPSEEKPQITKLFVSATTELLRFFRQPIPSSGSIQTSDDTTSICGFTRIEDVMDVLKRDYGRAYFLTGEFTRSLYAEDCYFADPTISFKGIDLYEQNLKLLIPFLEEPALTLFSMDKDPGEDSCVRASWQLRTRLRLPWRPIISVGGSTVYILSEQYKVISHVESWDISVWEALSQIFIKGNM